MRDILSGRNAVFETLRSKRRQFFSLQVADSARPAARLNEILELASLQRIPVSRVAHLKLESRDINHQGVVLEASRYPYVDLQDILDRAVQAGEPPFILILDALQDPQNFGALLRTAEIAGVHGVLMPLARAVEVTPAVVNASAGATEHLYIASANLAQSIDSLKKLDVWIVGLDPRGEALNRESDRYLRGALGLVVGSEGEGLHDLVRKKCDILLRLPMRGKVESLNTAVAGSIALFLAQLARQEPAGPE